MNLTAVLLGLFAVVGVAPADATVARPKMESVGMFKNGLCVVKCSFAAEQAGEFLWEEPPHAVHGRF